MKALLTGIDFIETSTGDVKLLEINTDTDLFSVDLPFLDLSNYIGAKNGQPTFTTTNEAEIWLESNGYRVKNDYWNSFAFLK